MSKALISGEVVWSLGEIRRWCQDAFKAFVSSRCVTHGVVQPWGGEVLEIVLRSRLQDLRRSPAESRVTPEVY